MSAPTVETTKPSYLHLGTLAADDDAGTREFTGLALPYDEDMDRPNWLIGASRQRFAQGAAVFRDVTIVHYGHDHLGDGIPIGRITNVEDTPDGPRIVGRLSTTPKADEVLTLMRDGVLARLSIGYYEKTWHLEDEGAVQVHDEIDVFEVSIVPYPQYDSAVIDNVLQHTPNPTSEGSPTMPETVDHTEDITALQAGQAALTEAFDQITRQITTLGENFTGNDAPVTIPGDSYGEFLQALATATPSPEAVAFLEYVGGDTGDLGDWMKDSWVGDIIRIVERSRHALNFFEQAPLPATGMGVEYGVIDADTTSVTKQDNEGDVLAYGKVTYKTARAALDTYGGWGEMSRQEIERSSLEVVERFFKALARRYGVATEAAVRGALQTAAGAESIGSTDLTDADGWITFLVEAAAHLDDKGLVPEAVFVSKDVFIDLATLRDGEASDAPRLLNRNSGQINVVGLSGDLFNVPVRMLGSLTENTVRVASSAAIKTWEAPGAPFRLQDDDITNLTKAFSNYGYLAVAQQEPDAIVVPGD